MTDRRAAGDAGGEEPDVSEAKAAKKSKRESPALTLLRLTYEMSSGVSNRRRGYALGDAMDAAINGGLKFDPDDLVRASKERHEGGFRFSRYLGQDVGERWYAKAVEAGHLSAMTALERWIGRPRFIYEGKVLHLGRYYDPQRDESSGIGIRLAEAITEHNQAGHVYLTSFSDDGKHANFRAHDDDGYRECEKCHRTIKKSAAERAAEATLAGNRKQKGVAFRLSFRDLDRQERARRAVDDRYFEVTSEVGDPPRVREFNGRTLVESARSALLELAKMATGGTTSLAQGEGAPPLAVKRIPYLTHDSLSKCDQDGEYGERVHIGWRGAGAEWKRYERLHADGLVSIIEGNHGHNPENTRYYILTATGRERLRLLSTQRELDEMDARERGRAEATRREALRREEEERTAPQQRAAAKARRAQVAARLLGEYTAEELATVVTRADSIAPGGNCATGTDNWIASKAPGRSEMTVRELIELDAGENEMNVRGLIRRGLERVRAGAGAAGAA